MTRTTKTSAHIINTSISQGNSSVSQEPSSSDQETVMYSASFQQSTSQAQQFVHAVFMPYIESPRWIEE